MSIIRVGSSEQYADNWDKAFKKAKTSPTKTKTKTAPKKSSAKKAETTPTKAAAKKSPAKKKTTPKKEKKVVF